MAIIYMVLNPNPFPKAKKARIRSMTFITGYDKPIGMPVANWMIVHNPVSPPLESPFGMMNDVHARQKIKPPKVIRK